MSSWLVLILHCAKQLCLLALVELLRQSEMFVGRRADILRHISKIQCRRTEVTG